MMLARYQDKIFTRVMNSMFFLGPEYSCFNNTNDPVTIL